MSLELLELIEDLKRVYEPRPTPWAFKNEAEQMKMTAEWVDRLGGFRHTVVARAINRWLASDKAEFCPSLVDVTRLCQEIARNDLASPIRSLPQEPFIDYRRGVEIAWEAYKAERSRLGLPINRTVFESFLPPQPKPSGAEQTERAGLGLMGGGPSNSRQSNQPASSEV